MQRNEPSLACRVVVKRKTGNERFECDPPSSAFTLLDFWRWSGSDLVGNVNRGRLAEFIVARALRLGEDVQNEWEGYDLTRNGVRVEVKSSAYVQSWPQNRFCNPSFSIAPRRAWDQANGRLGSEIRRHSDVYVFALLAHKDKESINPLVASQWEFYVVSTAELNRDYPIDQLPIRKTITLDEVHGLCPKPVPIGKLREAVESAARGS